MTLEMIETIRKLAETHDFKGVPIPTLCKMAARYAWLRDKALNQYQHPIVVEQRHVELGMRYIGPLFGEALDREIDAAMVAPPHAASGGSTLENK